MDESVFQFEMLTEEELEEETRNTDTIYEPVSREGLTWCEWCKEWYNEYHFGDLDD